MIIHSGYLLKTAACFLLLTAISGGYSPRLFGGRLEKIGEEVSKDPETKEKGGYYPFYDSDRQRKSGNYWPPYSTFNLPVMIPPYGTRSSVSPGSSSSTLFTTGNWDFYGGLNYFYDVQGDLEGYGLSSRMRTPFGTLDLDATRFREQVAGGYDYLNLYYINYCLSFGFTNLTFDVGAGYSGMWSGESYDGYGFLLAGEMLAFDPVLVQVDVRYSSINGTTVGDYRAGLGVVCLGVELDVRYRYVQIENAPDLQGPEVSIGYRF